MRGKSRAARQKDAQSRLLIRNEITGLILSFLAIFLFLSLISYTPLDPSPYSSPVDQNRHLIQNFGGKAGAFIASHLFQLLGYGSIVVNFYLFLLALFFFSNRSIRHFQVKSISVLLFLLALVPFLAHLFPDITIDGLQVHSGGVLGYFLNQFLVSQFRGFITLFLLILLMLIALLMYTKLSIRKIADLLSTLRSLAWGKIRHLVISQWERVQKKKRISRIRRKYEGQVDPPREERKPARDRKRKISRAPSKIPEEKTLFDDNDNGLRLYSEYTPPPLSYLDAPTRENHIDYRELDQKKDELLERLSEFNISGKIFEYTPGPVITTYEFIPDTGIKVKNVVNLSEDLALVAKTQYVRIERILGKKAIGIEVPNQNRKIINLREILESPQFRQASSPLTLGLGKSKSGEIFVSDLREMPHLIIAGATGSGKSVAIHSLILSILYKSSPETVRLILVDPKRVELAIYNRIPHLLTPVVTNMKSAGNALDWALYEMEQRYKSLAQLQVRDIDQYNKKLELLKQGEDEILDTLKSTDKLPYIVIIIDEFANLLTECGKNVEETVARLAQKARATGIHIVLATQRPSIDVITGSIKNNFPARLALAVPSKFDSRTIIDSMGAEKLLGKGDMLFLPPQTASLVRLHGAFVSETEVLRIVKYLSKTEKPQYDKTITKPRKESGPSGAADDLDPRFFAAARLIIETGHASASFLQRRLSVGYARAGRLVDQLVQRGVISESDSRNQREVLKTLEELEEMEKGAGSR